LDSIESQISPWTASERAIGQKVAQLLEPKLREILTKTYQASVPNFAGVDDELYRTELNGFRRTFGGDHSAEFFKTQAEIASSIAKEISFTQFLVPGYATYATELMMALIEVTRWTPKKTRHELVSSAMRAIFVEVSVAMHHFFQELASKAEADRAEFDRNMATESENDQISMRVLSQALNRLAQRDLSEGIAETVPAKIEGAKADFNAAVSGLRGALSQINAASAEILAEVGDIAQASVNLSSRTESQAAALEEASAALGEVTANVGRAATQAAKAKVVVSNASTSAQSSEDTMLRAEAAMSEISRNSGEINAIVAVIDQIAFQTNLLALNAGVEAARAGDAGKGFAVVAAEVRALAQRSAEAAKQIHGLITQSADSVEKGVTLIGGVGRNLSEISGHVREMSDLIEEIAHVSSDQSQSLGEVNAAINQLDKVTQQNAAMAEETSAALGQLGDKAHVLQSLIGEFKTEAAAIPSSYRRAG
jgi:methyl-accepting chemotaxis protein